jgi:hypothetical protein
MATDGQKWQLLAKNGNLWSKLATLCRTATDGRKWPLMVKNGQFCPKRSLSSENGQFRRTEIGQF